MDAAAVLHKLSPPLSLCLTALHASPLPQAGDEQAAQYGQAVCTPAVHGCHSLGHPAGGCCVCCLCVELFVCNCLLGQPLPCAIPAGGCAGLVQRLQPQCSAVCASTTPTPIYYTPIPYTLTLLWCLPPQVIRLTEEDTTSSSRIFIKILFQVGWGWQCCLVVVVGWAGRCSRVAEFCGTPSDAVERHCQQGGCCRCDPACAIAAGAAVPSMICCLPASRACLPDPHMAPA